jgi:N-acetylneuraminic acid mutarotase
MGIAVLNGLIYAAGGLVDGGTAVGDLTVYNPATNTWATLAPMPTPRDHLIAEAANGRLYAIGGRPTTINAPVAANEAYNPTTNTWEARAPMPTARGGHGSGVLDGKIVVFGGEGNVSAPNGMFGSTQQYDPASNTWTTLAPMITPRHGTNGAVVNNVIYVPAGGTQTGGSSSTIHEAFSMVSSGSTLTQGALSLGFFAFLFGCLYRARRRVTR